MAAAYSVDLRVRVLKDADAGLSSKELAERYHVSRAWVDALQQRRRETGSFAARPQTKFRGRVLAGHEDRLAALLAARPDATLAELREGSAPPCRGTADGCGRAAPLVSEQLQWSWGPALSRPVPIVTRAVTHGRETRRLATERADSGEISTRRDGRVVDGGGLENLQNR